MELNLQNELSNLLTNVKSINNDNRLSWDQYFMTIATVTSLRSPCERLKVGCVLVKDKRIISTGYNGFLPGAKHESIVRYNHEQATVHAEQNTISNASKNVLISKLEIHSFSICFHYCQFKWVVNDCFLNKQCSISRLN